MAAEGPPKEGPTLLRTMVDDPEAFARNLARVIEEGGKAMAAYLEPREHGAGSAAAGQQGLSDVVKTFAHVGEYWLRDPQRAVEAQARLWNGYLGLWGSTMRRLAGEDTPPVASTEPADKRFRDPDWSQNAFFDFLKQAYLIGSRWAEDMVKEADELDEHTRHKAEFYIRQLVAALSPSNFVLTNPELLRETLASNGENLARGMKMLAEDIKAGGGELKIRQTGGHFRVGENLAVSPGKVIFENDICQVIQYAPATETVLARPLLIVPPWINKYYILDLTPEKSFVKWAVDQGHTVFLVSWVNPDARHATKGFEDYMNDGILAALDVALKATGAEGANLVGYCVGGTLLAMALAYMAAKGDERVKSATFFTAQVDFTHAGDLKVFIDDEQIAALEALMADRGYLPGEKMAGVFNMLRSQDLIWPYVVNNYIRGQEPFPFDLLHWNSDSTRLPAANHSFYLRNCYLDNRLVKGEIEIGGVKLDLGRITVPIYTLATREDHIAPAQSVFLGARSFGGPVRFVLAGSGHIAGVVNHPSRNKYQHWTGGPPVGTLDDWLATAEEHPGSWWPDWQRWIAALDDARVPAREAGGGIFAPIEDAPGRYVATP